MGSITRNKRTTFLKTIDQILKEIKTISFNLLNCLLDLKYVAQLEVR